MTVENATDTPIAATAGTDGAAQGGHEAPAGSPEVRSEIASIVATMRSDRPAYDRDEKLQARYRELLDQAAGNTPDARAAEEAPADRKFAEFPTSASPIGGTSTLEAVKAGGFERDEVMAVLDWVHNDTKLPAHELAAIDASSKTSTRAELANLWGATAVDANLSAINRYVDTHFNPNVAFAIKNARDADGKAFANNPAFLQRLLGLAKQAPSKGAAAGSGSVDDQISDIINVMRNDRPAYDRNEQLQARYRELLVQKYGS